MPQQNNMPGLVYLLAWQDLHKIGNTDNLYRRVQALSGRYPGVAAVHAFPSECAGRIEHALHRRFQKQRQVVGNEREWYLLTPDDIDLIRSLSVIDRVEDLPSTLQPPPPERMESIKIRKDVHRKLRTLACNAGIPLTDLLDQLLRPRVNKMFAEHFQVEPVM